MGLTSRQREILDFIQAFTAKEGYPPTVREIAGHFRLITGRPSTTCGHWKGREV